MGLFSAVRLFYNIILITFFKRDRTVLGNGALNVRVDQVFGRAAGRGQLFSVSSSDADDTDGK